MSEDDIREIKEVKAVADDWQNQLIVIPLSEYLELHRAIDHANAEKMAEYRLRKEAEANTAEAKKLVRDIIGLDDDAKKAKLADLQFEKGVVVDADDGR